MLRVTIELLPDGDADLVRQLARLDVTNDSTGTAWNGRYDVTLTHFLRDGTTYTRTGRLEDFDRERPAVDLVVAALSVVNPVRRGMAMFPDPDPSEPA
jgi:hypothetical protein